MKAVPGLVVALILGGAAVVFNWIYLEKKASEFQVVSFLGIRDDVTDPTWRNAAGKTLRGGSGSEALC